MKTSVDIPSSELDAAIRFSGAKTKNQAVNVAIKDYNRRQRLARLAEKLGTFDKIMTLDELDNMRKG